MAKAIRPSNKVYTPKNRVLSTLQNNMTKPDAKYGDSPQKIKPEIPGLLNSHGLPAEASDIQAAVILLRCGMEINEENLTSLKGFYSRVTKLMDSLHPKIAVYLLNAGVNPLETPIDELQTLIDSFGGRYDSTDFIGSIRDIEPKTRPAVIGLHKALNMIRRREGEAFGYALKSGRTATLGDLLSMASGPAEISYKISDVTPLKQTVMREDSIRAVIKRACAYDKTLLTN